MSVSHLTRTNQKIWISTSMFEKSSWNVSKVSEFIESVRLVGKWGKTRIFFFIFYKVAFVILFEESSIVLRYLVF